MKNKRLFEGFSKLIETDLPKLAVRYHIDTYNRFVSTGVQKIVDEIENIPLDDNIKLLLL